MGGERLGYAQADSFLEAIRVVFVVYNLLCDESFLSGPYFMFDFPAKVLVYRPSMWIIGILGNLLPLVPRSHKVTNFTCYKTVGTSTNFDCFDGSMFVEYIVE